MQKLAEQKYYPQLNALRGIGVISVFLYHSYKPPFGTGFFAGFLSFCYENIYLSMDMFFALSSFIITHLAFNEMDRKGNFSFKNFIIRRVLRIWPLYFLLLFIAYGIIDYLAKHFGQPITLPPASWYFLFISNFYLEGHVFFLRQLWTISVEEQFYIIWGICLAFLSKHIKPVIFFLALVSIGFNIYSAYQNHYVYYHSLTYLFDMMAGAYFAYLIHKGATFIQFIKSGSTLKSLTIYLFIPLFFFTYYLLDESVKGKSNAILDVIMRMVFIIHHCIMFVDQMYNEQSFFNLARRKFLIYVGEIAYGVYCFHGLIITIGLVALPKWDIHLHPILFSLVFFGITLMVGSVSYRYFEMPFLRLKKKLNRV